MATLKIGDEEYPLDMAHLSLAEALQIKSMTGGMTISGFMEGITTDLDPQALQAAIWLAKSRAGATVNWKRLEKLDIADIDIEFDPSELVGDDDEDEDEDEDPTVPEEKTLGTSTSKPSDSSTSESSPSASTGHPETSMP